jgi:hypothetical protein
LGIDSAYQGANLFIGLVQADGHTMIRDPQTSPSWHDISTVPGYPASGVTDVTLAVEGGNLHVTVRGAGDTVFGTTCIVTPAPTWPANCSSFQNFTPPLFRGPESVSAFRDVAARRSREAATKLHEPDWSDE